MATGNTTSLNMGPSGSGVGVRDFKDATARALSLSISKGNYQQAMKTDEKFRLFNQYVYAMVSKWSVEDKLNIISEYGDSTQLGNNPSEDQINRICAMSIIVNLSQADLELLVSDVKMQIEKLRSKARKLNRKRSSLKISTFEDFYGELKDVKSAKKYKNIRRKMDRGFKVPKALEGQYNNLRKELKDVINNIYINVIEITGLAMRMGIEIEDSMPRKVLVRNIINKTTLFVDLIVGKSKRIMSGAYMDPAPFEELLQYTSFAYVVGKPGMSRFEFAELAREARIAKKTIQERFKMTKQRKGTKSKAFGDVAGVHGSKRKVRKALMRNDIGVLADMDMYELSKLAAKYGIDSTKLKNADLKMEIYRAMAADNAITKKLEKRVNKNLKSGKEVLDRDINDRLQVRKRLQYPLTRETGVPTEADNSMPIITLGKDGSVQNTSITRALAVYIVGQGPAGNLKNKEKGFGDKAIPSTPGFGEIGDVIHNKYSGKGKGDLSAADFYEISYIEKMAAATLDLLGQPIPGSSGVIDLDYLLSRNITKSLKYPEEFTHVGHLFALLKSNKKINQKTLIAVSTNFKEAFSKAKNEEKLNMIRRFAFQLLWIKSMIDGKRSLAKYLEEKYGSAVNKYKSVKHSISKGLGIGAGVLGGGAGVAGIGAAFGAMAAGYTLMGLAGAGVLVGAGIGIAKMLKAIGKWKKFKNFSDLPAASQKNFQKFNQQDINNLRNYILKNLKADGTVIDTFVGDQLKLFPEAYQKQVQRWLLIALAAKFEPDMPLFNHSCWKLGTFAAGGSDGPADPNEKDPAKVAIIETNANKIKDAINELYKTISKISNVFGKIGFTLKNIFKKRGDVLDTGEVNEDLVTNDDEASSFDPKKNPGQRMPIPKVDYLGEGKVNEPDILEVVPVYVVNSIGGKEKYEKRGWGSDGKNAGGGEKTNRELTFEDYAKKFGSDTVENGLIKLKDPDDKSVAQKADEAVGRKTKESSVFKKKGYYLPTKETIAWAIQNNQQFAEGGYSFISGDSVNGKQNPEVVTINGNGGFSVRPLKAGPANNYSPYAMDRYATEGKGILSQLIKSPEEKMAEELQFIMSKNSLVAAASQMGLDPGEFGIIEADKPSKLSGITKKMLKAYQKNQKTSGKDKKKKSEKGPEKEGSVVSTEAISLGLTEIDKKPAIPVYLVNKDIMAEATDRSASWMAANLPMYFMGFSTDVLAAPYGVGTIVRPLMASMSGVNMALAAAGAGAGFAKDLAAAATMNTGGKISRFNTGGRSKGAVSPRINRFPTGGTMAITGDAAGPNMFANGAAPELVESTGDLSITPLNPLGKETKQKVSRMTASERNKPLAVGVSSHVVVFKTKLPDGVSEISNTGEAIKVFNVNQQGIYDSVNGAPSLYDMITAIYTELTSINSNSGAQTQLLGEIAKNTIPTSSGSSPSGGNPFAGGFPESMNGILEGM